jgi:hypothetical protein
MCEEDDVLAYSFTISNLPGSGLPDTEARAVWRALLGDLILATAVLIIVARFLVPSDNVSLPLGQATIAAARLLSPTAAPD